MHNDQAMMSPINNDRDLIVWVQAQLQQLDIELSDHSYTVPKPTVSWQAARLFTQLTTNIERHLERFPDPQ